MVYGPKARVCREGEALHWRHKTYQGDAKSRNLIKVCAPACCVCVCVRLTPPHASAWQVMSRLAPFHEHFEQERRRGEDMADVVARLQDKIDDNGSDGTPAAQLQWLREHLSASRVVKGKSWADRQEVARAVGAKRKEGGGCEA